VDTAELQPILVSVKDAMKATGLSKMTLYAMLRDGSLRSITAGKRRLVIVSSIHEWIANREKHGLDQLGTK
jgi:excisionase family DNA binding protein